MGKIHFDGYLKTSIYFQKETKSYYSHRFIWESINQQIIPDGYQIHHINNDKQDNSIDNLELVTRQQNMIYDGKIRLGKQKSKKQNVPIKCEKFYYHHIYTNFGANKYGQIYNKKTNRCIIRNLLPTGYLKTSLNQIGLTPKYLLVHRFVYECYHGNIPDGMQINHIDSNRQNNCIHNLEVVTQSENLQHAYESIKIDIKMKESDDEFTEDEKHLINKKYNIMMKKINKGDYPYKKQLQEHLPGMEFW